jgi:hypothetical protein
METAKSMTEQKIILFIGDVGPETAEVAQRFDPAAKLITDQNLQDLGPGVFYTSLGDLSSLSIAFALIDQADELRLVTPPQWSDTRDHHSGMEYCTKKFLMYYKGKKSVYFDCLPNDWNSMLSLNDTRKTENSQLWIAGCSISHGIGVNPDQRYGYLLSQKTNLPVSFLTQSRTSITWAADQIIRSDIRQGDTVIWGVTSHRRYPYYTTQLNHVFVRYYEQHPEFDQIMSLDRLDDHNMIYLALTKIHQVINFCRKIGANLRLACVLADEEFSPYVFNLPNAINLSPVPEFALWPDLGTDNMHPGPKTHQWYANEIYTTL